MQRIAPLSRIIFDCNFKLVRLNLERTTGNIKGFAAIIRGKLSGTRMSNSKKDNLVYIQEMLVELRQVADKEGEDMLCYLIEMAYLEAGDILTKKPDGELDVRADGHSSSGMPI